MDSLLSVWSIRKATLTFVAKFLRLLVWSEGVCGLKRIIKNPRGKTREAVIVAALVSGSRVDFAASFLANPRRSVETSRDLPLSLPYFDYHEGLQECRRHMAD
ncbi:hypothetical protein H5410_061906 [Solanum commersonii]|uniref:Uncharacterized protein n=1 Tax=Solanum commersonii TaxID=4109 RepID=A0A9J5WA52_SOLCO|nr:hypothetical protein H5410_061906 [Solanum commersonii]